MSLSELPDPLEILYREMRAAERKVGGGEGCCGVNGTVTEPGMRRITAALVQHCGLCSTSTVVDTGSALGRPLLHFAVAAGAAGFGIEMDEVKCQKSLVFLDSVVATLRRQHPPCAAAGLVPPTVICRMLEQIESLEPATHVYAAWEGFSEASKAAVGALFAASTTAQAIAIVQRGVIFGRRDPEAEMRDRFGFGDLRLVETLSVQLAGGHTKLRAYVMVKRTRLCGVDPDSLLVGTAAAHKRRRAPSQAAATAATAGRGKASTQLHELPSFVPRVVTVEQPYNTRRCKARV